MDSFDMVTWSSELYAGDYDLSLNYTYGVPYEPHITISGILSGGFDDAAMDGMDCKPVIDGYITELQQTSVPEEVDELIGNTIETIHSNYANIPLTYENELVVFNNTKIKDIGFFGQPGLTVIKNITPVQ